MAIKDSVTIQGPGAANLTIDAQGQSRIFNVNDGNNGRTLMLRSIGLTLTGGNASGTSAPDNWGGAIFSVESLTVRDSTITGNTASGSGGGIYIGSIAGGTATITDSTISGNAADQGGAESP